MCTVSQVRCAVLSAASKVECPAVDSLLQLDEESFPAAFSQASPTKFDPTKAKVLYWSTGLFYQDPDVIFRVETTLSTRVQHRVTITASPSSMGRRFVGQVLDTIEALTKWYPGLQPEVGSVGQAVLCSECLKDETSRSVPV